jgi:hypothetical protein
MLRTRITRLFIAFLLSGTLGFAAQPQPTQTPSTPASKLIFVVSQISLVTTDIIYEPVSGKIYASTPSTAGSYGNSIVPVSVPGGAVGPAVFVGSEPNKLAVSDNGQFLYVGLDGASAVRSFNVISQTAGLQFSLGSTHCGALRAEDMVVLEGDPHAVAISLANGGCSPRHEGVAIYDDGVRRPDSTPGHTGSNVIEPSNSGSVLYGYNNETTEFGFRVMSVISTGVVVTSSTAGAISGFGTDIRFDNGLVYATSGAVINPATGTLAGTYAGYGLVQPDTPNGRVFILGTGNNGGSIELHVFNQATFTPIDDVTISGVSGTPSSLIMAGDNLLAFRTSGGQVYFVRFLELDHSVYLPLIQSDCMEGICGRVSLNGAFAPDIALELRFFDGANWSTVKSTITSASGNYAFTDAASLAPGQLYYVLYRNDAHTAGRVWVWAAPVLTSYSAFTKVSLATFDIADIPLVQPANGATVALPSAFEWTRRAATPSDTYEFNLYDPDDGDPYFYTAPPLGYVDTFTLNGLPPGFSTGAQYGWDLWVYSADGGYGISLETRPVTFSNTGASVTPATRPERLETNPDWAAWKIGRH